MERVVEYLDSVIIAGVVVGERKYDYRYNGVGNRVVVGRFYRDEICFRDDLSIEWSEERGYELKKVYFGGVFLLLGCFVDEESVVRVLMLEMEM